MEEGERMDQEVDKAIFQGEEELVAKVATLW
jgi:hypothetical protein